MLLEDSASEAAFREQVRGWLVASGATAKTRAPQVMTALQHLDGAGAIAEAKQWQRRLADAGWGAVTWPVDHGGRAAGPLEAMVFAEELARYDIPVDIFRIGLAMVGPTLLAHGSEAQKARYLPPMLRGDEVWCQLWSEPDAGSDLAALRSRAVLDHDRIVINGQKLWTSGAHYCDFGLGLFRTGSEKSRSRGISALIVPMDAPGVTVRPLRQINGAAHFNEVFFDGVEVPAENLVGAVNGGWTVAHTTLMNERLAVSSIGSMTDAATAAIAEARRYSDGRGSVASPLVLQELAHIYARARMFDITVARVRAALTSGTVPERAVSILKLLAAEVGSEIAEAAWRSLGARGALWAADAGGAAHEWIDGLLGSFAMHIGGGTDQIQRNVVSETVLGLPREPKP